MNNDEIIGMLEERGGTYRLLARLFFKPLTQEEIDALVVSGFAEAAWAGTDACDEGCNDIARYLRRRNTGTREELACDFTSAFYGTITVEGRTAMPYESLFRFGGTQLMGVPQGECTGSSRQTALGFPRALMSPRITFRLCLITWHFCATGLSSASVVGTPPGRWRFSTSNGVS